MVYCRAVYCLRQGLNLNLPSTPYLFFQTSLAASTPTSPLSLVQQAISPLYTLQLFSEDPVIRQRYYFRMTYFGKEEPSEKR